MIKPTRLSIALSVLLGVMMLWFCISVTMLGLLPVGSCILLWLVGGAGAGLLSLLMLGRNSLVGKLVSVLLTVLLAAGCFGVGALKGLLNDVSDMDVVVHAIGVYVLKEDSAQTLEDAREYTFGILGGLDRSNTDLCLAAMEKELGQSVSVTEFEDAAGMMEALGEQRIQAMILNHAYLALLQEETPDLEEQLRRIWLFESTRDLNVPKPQQNQEAEAAPRSSFVVYVSGNDSYGELSSSGRSDVNLLMAVNPDTGRVLLVNTPRDYYVETPVSGGDRDKLTHAGIYGVDVSMGTLSMLYGVPVDHYVRMNFSGFMEIIDALGGVEVVNEEAFNAGGYHFDAGTIDLDGSQALAFVRERHSFAGGDRTRGQHQAAVLRAVIRKLTSTALLANYGELMQGLEDAFETSMTREEISAQVQRQLLNKTQWQVDIIAVDGSNDSGPNYSMPHSNVYRMIPDEELVADAREQLCEVLGIPQEEG